MESPQLSWLEHQYTTPAQSVVTCHLSAYQQTQTFHISVYLHAYFNVLVSCVAHQSCKAYHWSTTKDSLPEQTEAENQGELADPSLPGKQG